MTPREALPGQIVRLSAPAAYTLAGAAALVAVLLRSSLDPVWGLRFPFILFYPAITVSAWLGGFWPGMLTTVLSAAAVEYFWLEPVRSWRLADPADALGVLILVALGMVISGVNQSSRRVTIRALDLERERAAQLDQERQARSVAERANRTKDEFLAILSHELRTPLQAILGYAHVLKSRSIPAERFTQAVDAIHRSALAQGRLVDSLLDLARIEAGKLELQQADVDLSAVVSGAVDAVRPMAEEKRLTIEHGAPQSTVRVRGDGGRLEQVVWNLLSNAVKFTPPGGRVEVRLEQLDGRAEVRVTDTGQGISAELLPRVFERFAQAESARTRVDGGLGLGLTIVRELVKAHGGTVVAESDGEEKGSTFTLTLPVR